jgi:hypothetical protein
VPAQASDPERGDPTPPKPLARREGRWRATSRRRRCGPRDCPRYLDSDSTQARSVRHTRIAQRAGSSNRPPPARARPAPVAGEGGRAQNLYAMPLHATALSMVSGQRFYVGPACSSYSDRATCRLKRPTPRRARAQRQSLCMEGCSELERDVVARHGFVHRARTAILCHSINSVILERPEITKISNSAQIRQKVKVPW